jgi:hypothetical protein
MAARCGCGVALRKKKPWRKQRSGGTKSRRRRGNEKRAQRRMGIKHAPLC